MHIAWMKKVYAWFTDDVEVGDRNGGVHIGDNNFWMMMLTLIQM